VKKLQQSGTFQGGAKEVEIHVNLLRIKKEKTEKQTDSGKNVEGLA